MLVLIVGALIGVIAIHELAQFVLRRPGESPGTYDGVL